MKCHTCVMQSSICVDTKYAFNTRSWKRTNPCNQITPHHHAEYKTPKKLSGYRCETGAEGEPGEEPKGKEKKTLAENFLEAIKVEKDLAAISSHRGNKEIKASSSNKNIKKSKGISKT